MKNKNLIIIITFILAGINAFSQETIPENYVEVYGFAVTDMGYNLNQVNPDWYDVMRSSRLPSYKNQYGADGYVYVNFTATKINFSFKYSFNQNKK